MKTARLSVILSPFRRHPPCRKLQWWGGKKDWQRCLREEVSECAGEDVVWRIHMCIIKRSGEQSNREGTRGESGSCRLIKRERERERGEERTETSSTPASICRRLDLPEHSCWAASECLWSQSLSDRPRECLSVDCTQECSSNYAQVCLQLFCFEGLTACAQDLTQHPWSPAIFGIPSH